MFCGHIFFVFDRIECELKNGLNKFLHYYAKMKL